MPDQTQTTAGYTLEAIARACHEVNRAAQIAGGETLISPHWEQAPEWEVDSTLEAVKAILDGNWDPRAQHERWYAERVSEGWRWGPVRDNKEKINPALVADYDDVSAHQRRKDTLRAAVVGALTGHLAAAGEDR